ncbi:MAG: family 20 glycosylhydrolase [Capsulimonas sp.]|uniref:family 20 glycosylhydrolase n=1 Tax=Capsulimonas sp. TaxID=2494211 RepID=UPI0032656F96
MNLSRVTSAAICLAAFVLHAAPTLAQTNLLPLPSKAEWNTGRFKIEGKFGVAFHGARDPRITAAITRWRLSQAAIGLGVGPNRRDKNRSLDIDCYAAVRGQTQSVKDDESYTLSVDEHNVYLEAPGPLGIVRGLETVRQLTQVENGQFYLPTVEIHDKPRFAWRGLMIDVSRHWMPVETIERTLDKMASVKLNVFHWHLSDDQGFRVESKVFPKLTQMGSEGKFYTQQQIKAIVAYARDRGIRVVPEFDIPGHTTALLTAYPELASAPGPYSIAHNWGIHTATLDPTNERVYAFLDKFFGEMARLFPDQYVHIGGDEVNGTQWSGNAKIQEFLKSHGLADNNALQAYFNGRVSDILKKHGKSMIGWDEILAPGLPPSTAVQSWRGKDALAAAAREGRFAILSHGYYLDNPISVSEMYANDPAAGPAATLSASEQALILGGEACMWTERVTPAALDARVWPRAAAVAERLWSPAAISDTDDLARRLKIWFPLRTETQAPYGGAAAAIPGTIQIEDYDRGGEGVSYHDFDGVNTGEGYREEEMVDVEPFDGGFDVGYTRPGQWLKYTVQVQNTGTYDLGVRVSSAEGGGSFHLEDETGQNLTGSMNVTVTGSWDIYTVVHASVKLRQGQRVLKLVEDTGGYNLDSMAFTAEK